MRLFELSEPLRAIQDEATTSTSADLAELSEGEEQVEETEETEPEVPGADEIEGETEEATEEVEKTEEPEQVLHPFARPSIKEITESFPELFKKFPSLRDMYFREHEFSKVFPTIDDAKEAQEESQFYNTIRSDIFEGNGSKLFSGIKDSDPKALDRFATTILPALFQTQASAFWRAANPLVEDIARNMFEKGVKSGDESLQNAARHLTNYFFGNVEIAEGKRTSIVKDEPTSEVKEEREAWDQEKYQDFRSRVETDVRKDLVSLIEGMKDGKSKLDPDGVFSKFIHDTIIEKVISDLGDQLSSDKDHMRFMDSLWDRAKRSGRTDSDKSRIISAYLARAKSLIPTLRSKYVSEALGNGVRRAVKSKEILEKATSRVSSPSGRPSNGRARGYNPKEINYNKTSDIDIINDDITYK